MKTWPKVKLGEVILQIRGVSYAPQNASEMPKDDYVPILRAHNIQDDGLDFAKLVYVDSSKVSERQFLQEGDIVICASSGSKGLVGKAARFNGSGRFSFGAFCKAARPCGGNSRYLAHFFASKSYRREISNLAAGANINNIKNEHIDRLEIPLPPLAEQERIAAELDAVVATLKKRQAQLAELDALVESRFVELFGDPATNPKGWTIKILKDCLAEIQSGNREKGGALLSGVPSLGAEHINNDGGFNLQPEKLKYIGEEFYCNLKRGKIQIGDVLLVKDGATTGKTGYVTSSFPFEKAAVNEHVFLLRSKPIMLNVFLFHYLRSKVGKERVLGKFHGATIGGITKDFALIEIPVPPLELQERFAAEVERVEALKVKVRDGIAETQTLFDALTQKYFG